MNVCHFCQRQLAKPVCYGPLYFCSEVCLQDHLKQRQEDERVRQFLGWLTHPP
jgi:Zn-finger protein